MLTRFFRSEPAAGIVLFAAAALAMLVANTGLNDAYHDLLDAGFAGLSVHAWINDGLMAIFFLLVGLEIKQELSGGELGTWRSRALPGLAAIGGMLVPALLFTAINVGSTDTLRGWAIPSATDIAFAIGVLALLGPRVPPVLRVLLVGIAIIDDLGAILIIAVFYTTDLSVPWLALAVAVTAALAMLNRRGVDLLPVYLALGVVLWIAIHETGIHATLAGVILAFAIPAASVKDPVRSPMKTTETAIDRWVSFLVLPLFGFANAGVAFAGLERSDVLGALPIGIAAGLFIGKQVGIFGAIWLAVRVGLATRPPGTSWRQLHGLALLCGIGFTMSLFIGDLAFTTDADLTDATRIGVIAGSICSAVAGALVLRATLSDGSSRTDASG